MKNKKIALIVACVVVLTCAIGGTLAWLADTSDKVENTFSPSTINIELTESDSDNDENTNQNQYKMIPGWIITKDPVITVKEGSEPCWVFIKVEKSSNFDDFMTFDFDGKESTKWMKLEGYTNIYYYADPIKNASDKNVLARDVTLAIIDSNTVNVKDTVTKEAMDALTAETYPTLDFTAAAVQYYSGNETNFTPAEAFAKTSTDFQSDAIAESAQQP